ncbi:lipid-binding SYLF domain-containing protein [Rosistilla oblonga]|uniref:lipid-binding SYLF domain-containing protein n=1 Tax=Rosistilla oblonga TaxID=2527990 RepID=UPI003A977B99
MARYITCFLLLALATPPQSASAQSAEEGIVLAASAVLSQAMSTSLNQIPRSMLTDAHGVAIIPNVIKGGFIIGARHGRGLLFVRDPNGIWHAPVFITLTGGNIGWQAGLQSSDIVLVFKTAKSVEGILSGTLTIGADAAAAAGPVGLQGAVATDGRLQAEIYSYSRSRGLFAGVAIDGSVLQIDQLSTGTYYRSPAPGQPVVIPPAAQELTQRIANYAAGVAPTEGTSTSQMPPLAQRYTAQESDVLRGQLLQIAPKLFALLDEQWKTYLALPFSATADGAHPTPQQVQQTLAHFQSVATNPQFQQLAARPEFQSVYGLLQHYQQSLTPNTQTLQLPPPPTATPTATPPPAVPAR